MIKGKRSLFCYGFLAMPLWFIGISLFVYIPKVYNEQYGISLFTIGTVFLVTKLINFSLIPFIGIYLDRLNMRKIYRKKIIYLCLPLITVSFYFLVFPPIINSIAFTFFYLITCLLYTVITINYYAMTVEMTHDYRRQNYISGFREIFGLIGVMAATLFPTILNEKYGFDEAFNNMIFILITTLFSAAVLLHFVKDRPSFMFHHELSLKRMFYIATSKKHGTFLLALLMNGISLALQTTSSLFFIKYVINAEHLSGYMLLVFYSCAIISIPLWIRFSARNGKKNSWLIAIVFSALFYASTFFLGEGDIFEFFIVCIVTGFCLGGELMLAPSIYSDNIANPEKAAVYYSLWTLVSKLSMTTGLLITFSTLALFGLETGPMASETMHSNGIFALSFIYCLLPAILKIFAMMILFKAKIDVRFSK